MGKQWTPPDRVSFTASASWPSEPDPKHPGNATARAVGYPPLEYLRATPERVHAEELAEALRLARQYETAEAEARSVRWVVDPQAVLDLHHQIEELRKASRAARDTVLAKLEPKDD